MKKILTTLTLLVCAVASVTAQANMQPVFDSEVTRKVARMDIEGKIYEDATVTIVAAGRLYVMTDLYKLKIKIVDSKGKKVYKKTLSNEYLYIFPNGQIQVGKPHFDKLVIYPSSREGIFNGKLREKEGVHQNN